MLAKLEIACKNPEDKHHFNVKFNYKLFSELGIENLLLYSDNLEVNYYVAKILFSLTGGIIDPTPNGA